MKTLLHITLIAILTPIAAITIGIANPIIEGSSNCYEMERISFWDIKIKGLQNANPLRIKHTLKGNNNLQGSIKVLYLQ